MLFKRSFPITRRSKRLWFNTNVRVFTDRGHMNALGINLSAGGMGLFVVAHFISMELNSSLTPGSDEIPSHGTIPPTIPRLADRALISLLDYGSAGFPPSSCELNCHLCVRRQLGQ